MAVSPGAADEFTRYGLRPPASERPRSDATHAPRQAPPPGYAAPQWVEGGDAISDAFPETALRAEVSGTVLLNCRVTVDGTATNCAVLEETPAGFGFGEAALQASSRFRFKPATYQGRPIEVAQLKIPIRFEVR
nr:energy transducer TonB [Caulobacter sp. 17J65-9]